MTNVVSLNGERIPGLGEVNNSLVQALQGLLRDAESGVLQSFIGTGFAADGARVSLFTMAHPNVYEVLGSIAWLQHEYVDRTTGGEDDE